MLRRFSSLLFILISSALVVSVPPVCAQKTKVIYRTYSNARYKYSISYPAHLLEPQGEADDGDGEKFASKDGKALLLVYGTSNVNNDSVKTSFENALQGMAKDGRAVTYKAQKKNWFVISGRHGDNIFYSKTIHRGETLVTFVFEYPASERATYDSITTRIANSFSG
ncbi:MAG TPA: hypothetical protein VGC91_19820 [Pyrinomonadaceae bacterium]